MSQFTAKILDLKSLAPQLGNAAIAIDTPSNGDGWRKSSTDINGLSVGSDPLPELRNAAEIPPPASAPSSHESVTPNPVLEFPAAAALIVDSAPHNPALESDTHARGATASSPHIDLVESTPTPAIIGHDSPQSLSTELTSTADHSHLRRSKRKLPDTPCVERESSKKKRDISHLPERQDVKQKYARSHQTKLQGVATDQQDDSSDFEDEVLPARKHRRTNDDAYLDEDIEYELDAIGGYRSAKVRNELECRYCIMD